MTSDSRDNDVIVPATVGTDQNILTRRRFIQSAGALGAIAIVPAGVLDVLAAENAGSPFSLGVASGDPTDESIVLWTRLAPDPLNGGGMKAEEAEVGWQIASDPLMRKVVRAGRTTAQARNGHAVWVEVDDLRADRWYYYQFSYRGAKSRVGRTRTFPSHESMTDAMRFALVSCQHYESGYFAAYRDILGQDIDFVLHVGDYIYEYAADPAVPAERRHRGGEIGSLDDYRNRYALYRLDSDLQNAHAAFPFVVTWDDHEVDNNYAALIPEDDQSAQAFFARRRNAYRVYRETMPLSRRVRVDDGEMTLYRRLRYGRLADLFVLDTRQYRTDQPCGDNLQVLQTCPQILDPSATLLGKEQESWLFDGLDRSKATWKVLAQQVMMMRWDLGVLTGQPVNFFNVDAWDGYQVARDRITRFLGEHRIANPIVLSGDIHSSWAADLRLAATDTSSPIVASEFVGTSITSVFGDGNHAAVRATLPSNPHIKFFDGLNRGYALCTVTPSDWRTDFRAVQRVPGSVFTVPSADLPVATLASFGVKAGTPGVRKL
ncbi:MAG: alkaline phosphatase D family protein [Burkholderiales bacterium]